MSIDQLENLSNNELLSIHSKLKSQIKSIQGAIKSKQGRRDEFKKAVNESRKINYVNGRNIVELATGNVGDINSIVWPFYFSTKLVSVPRGFTTTANITVTQEAPFIFHAISKSVYTVENIGTQTEKVNYVNFEKGQRADDLSLTINDSSSGKSFFDQPINIDHFGSGTKPTKLDSPHMMLPNSNVEINLYNESATIDYKVQVTLLGYRVRIENSQDLLSLVQSE